MRPPKSHRLVSLTILTIIVVLSLSPSVSVTETLDELSWMAGYWQGLESDITMEECWLSPRGDLMVGMHRDTFTSGRVFFEYLRIEATEDGIVYYASPRGRNITPFAMVSNEDQRVVFENPEHDYPQRIIYELQSDGALRATIEGMEDGELTSSFWTWQRQVIGAAREDF